MKKTVNLALCLVLVLLFLPGISAHADENFAQDVYEKSGAEDLYEILPDDAKELLRNVGVEDVMTDSSLSSEVMFDALSDLVRDKLTSPLQALISLTVVVLLCHLAACFGGEEIIMLAGTAACGTVVILPLLSLIRSARLAVESAGVFLTAAVPVYAALMAASGAGAAGSSYSFLTLLAGDLIPVLCSSLLFPLLHILLALALLSAVSEEGYDGLAKSLYGMNKWLLILAVTLFTGALSLNTAISAQTDAASDKAVKLVISSTVPIVGGTLGDAVGAIRGSVGLIKSGAGAFGVLAALCIFTPSAIEAALWAGICVFGQTVADLFGGGKLSSLLGLCTLCAKMLLAILATVCAVCAVSAAIVLFVRGAS